MKFYYRDISSFFICPYYFIYLFSLFDFVTHYLTGFLEWKIYIYIRILFLLLLYSDMFI